MSPTPRQVFLVSHTHWDREWYLTFSRFRVNLTGVVGRVLDALENDPAFRHFVLDGQCAVLEDHLEAVPQDRSRVERLVRSRALALGPWYILPDEYLVSGEATVRNLMFGARTAAPFGGVQKVGYLPDSFGHPAQVPQILRLAGIDSFVFTRGLGDEAADLGWLFAWSAPDGSEVLAVNQCDGYCNAGGLGFKEIWHAHTRRRVDPELAVEKVRALLTKMATRPGAEPVLLNNGCDHFPPQQDFRRVLDALEVAFPATEFVHGRFEDFLRAARADTPDDRRPRHRGELLGGRDHLILSGVWSARMYLKQENEACQNLLARIVEPLAAMACWQDGDCWPQGLLDVAWRDLLRNHPHDSICGCSTDEVHQEMETRFRAVRQTGQQMLSRLMDRLAPTFARDERGDRDTVLAVANPLPWTRDEVVERLVILQPLGYDLDRLRLIDDTGNEVPCVIAERRFLERFWGIDYRAENFSADQLRLLNIYLERFGDRIIGDENDRDSKDCFLTLRFLARDLPALGWARYHLVDTTASAAAPVIQRPVTAGIDPRTARAYLENEHLRVDLAPDGRFDLLDKASGRLYRGLNGLEDTEDVGDEYDYCAAPDGWTCRPDATDGSVAVVQRDGLTARAEAVCLFELPRSAGRNRRSRSTETAICPFRVAVVLKAGARRVEIETTFDNRAEDHRLRAEFPTGIVADEVVSDGQFLLDRRPLTRRSGHDWDQPAPPTWPQQDFSLIHDERGGLAVLNRGLPEFQTCRAADGTVTFALTLMRCVGWLSRDDFASRRCTNAGPTLFTPGAQCPGPRTFAYAVWPFSGDPVAAGIRRQSDEFRVPCVTHQGVNDQCRPAGRSLLQQSDPRAAITAIKLSATGGRLIVRLFNQTDEPVVEQLLCGLPVLDVEPVNLLEGPLASLDAEPSVTHGGRRVRIPLGPHAIATVAITFTPKADRDEP